MSIVIEVLYSSCCPFYQETVESIQKLSVELGIQTDVNLILIDEMDKAIEYSFLGSPSVRINGLDIDPRIRRTASVGLT